MFGNAITRFGRVVNKLWRLCSAHGASISLVEHILSDHGAVFHTVPKPFPPGPLLVVPYKLPAASRITLPHGAMPSV